MAPGGVLALRAQAESAALSGEDWREEDLDHSDPPVTERLPEGFEITHSDEWSEVVRFTAPDGSKAFAEVERRSGWDVGDGELHAILRTSSRIDPKVRLQFTVKDGNDAAWVEMRPGRQRGQQININSRDRWDEERWRRHPEGHFVSEFSQLSMADYLMAHEHGHVRHEREWDRTERVQAALAEVADRPGIFDAEHFAIGAARSRAALTCLMDQGMSRYGATDLSEAIPEAHVAWWSSGRDVDALADRPALAAVVRAMGWHQEEMGSRQ